MGIGPRIAIGALSLLAMPGTGGVFAQAQDGAAGPTIVIDTGQHSFRVPYRYLSMWPPLSEIRPVNHWPKFGFAFWMPDGRPPAGGYPAGAARAMDRGGPPARRHGTPRPAALLRTTTRPASPPPRTG